MQSRQPVRPDVRLVLCGLIALTAALLPRPCRAEGPPESARWEEEIAAFERQDREKPPPRSGVVFVGSSSIRLWDLPRSFPGLGAINRGFGGSQLADAVHFAPRVVLKYRPRLVVLYAGDNDIAAGKSPERVADDFRAFVKEVHGSLPKARIAYLSIKPSILRRPLWGKMRRANALIEAVCRQDGRLVFIDVAMPMLGEDGKPRAELFREDGLHLNARGYALWAPLVRPYLR